MSCNALFTVPCVQPSSQAYGAELIYVSLRRILRTFRPCRLCLKPRILMRSRASPDQPYWTTPWSQSDATAERARVGLAYGAPDCERRYAEAANNQSLSRPCTRSLTFFFRWCADSRRDALVVAPSILATASARLRCLCAAPTIAPCIHQHLTLHLSLHLYEDVTVQSWPLAKATWSGLKLGMFTATRLHAPGIVIEANAWRT